MSLCVKLWNKERVAGIMPAGSTLALKHHLGKINRTIATHLALVHRLSGGATTPLAQA